MRRKVAAATAVAAGSFSSGGAIPAFAAVFIGSVVVGWIPAKPVGTITERIIDAPSSAIFQFVMTFGVWLVAERRGLSGVVTIVVFGLTWHAQAPRSCLPYQRSGCACAAQSAAPGQPRLGPTDANCGRRAGCRNSNIPRQSANSVRRSRNELSRSRQIGLHARINRGNTRRDHAQHCKSAKGKNNRPSNIRPAS
jgi:hypothetical protein